MAGKSLFPVQPDRWDSYFFKAPVARLHIAAGKRYQNLYDEIKDYLRRAKKEKIKFIFIRLDIPNSLREKVLLKAGFKDCGKYINLIFRCSTPLKIIPPEGYGIRPFEKKDLAHICGIAKDAFRFSYLYRSGFVRKRKIDLYHKAWLKNQTVDKDYLVFVTEKEGDTCGFVTINLKNSKESARMSLMAVHEKHRGKGLGDFMIRSMLLQACRRKKDTHFRTQDYNKYAVPVYKKMGCETLNYEKMFFKKV